MREQRRQYTLTPKSAIVSVIAIMLAVVVACLLGGESGAGAGSGISTKGLTATHRAEEFSVNVHGLTYGNGSDVERVGSLPDLIAATATNGRLGYVRWSEMNQEAPSSPEQAASFTGRIVTIPVYDVSGDVVIGEFEFGLHTGRVGS